MAVYIVYMNDKSNEIAGVFDNYDKAMDFIDSAPEYTYFGIPDEWEVQ